MTNVDPDLTRLLQEAASRSPAGPMPLEDLIEGGRRIEKVRRRRMTATVTAAVLVIAGGTAATRAALTDNASEQPTSRPVALIPGEWAPLPTSPLSPRAASITAWTGTEALFIGGQDHPDCYSGTPMGCPRPTPVEGDLPDGAAYDPATNSWHLIAEAPMPLSNRYSSAVVGDRVVIAAAEQGHEPTWLMYDVSDDAWTTLPTPEGIGPEPGLAADDTQVYVMTPYPREERVLALDVNSMSWRSLPLRPDAGRIVAGELVGLDNGVAVIGHLAPATTPDAPVTMDVYDGRTWRTTTGDDVYLSAQWFWTGERLVAPVPNYSADIHAGAAYDPTDPTAEYEEIPLGPPSDQPDLYTPQVAANGTRIAAHGFVYDDATRSWTQLPTPEATAESPAPVGDIAAVWAEDNLITLGGFLDVSPMSGRMTAYEHPTAEAWIWSPASTTTPDHGDAAPGEVQHLLAFTPPDAYAGGETPARGPLELNDSGCLTLDGNLVAFPDKSETTDDGSIRMPDGKTLRWWVPTAMSTFPTRPNKTATQAELGLTGDLDACISGPSESLPPITLVTFLPDE